MVPVAMESTESSSVCRTNSWCMNSTVLKGWSLFVAVQGLVAAVVPQLCIYLGKKVVGMNFENAAQLEAKPSYIRQLRALGVGMLAAGLTGFLLEKRAEGKNKSDEPETLEEALAEDEPAGADTTEEQ